MTSSKEAVIRHLIWYLTQAATTGCVFSAATLLIIDPFAALRATVACCQIFNGDFIYSLWPNTLLLCLVSCSSCNMSQVLSTQSSPRDFTRGRCTYLIGTQLECIQYLLNLDEPWCIMKITLLLFPWWCIWVYPAMSPKGGTEIAYLGGRSISKSGSTIEGLLEGSQRKSFITSEGGTVHCVTACWSMGAMCLRVPPCY